jgi:PhoPQ-activated pathogenicity-related protein
MGLCKLFPVLAALLLAPLISSLPLDDYVDMDDGAFSWNTTDDVYNGTLRGGGWSAVALNVSTQYWQPGAWQHTNANYPSTSGLVWHKVLFVIPDVVDPARAGQALIYITGGDNGNTVNINKEGFGDEDLSLASELAVRTGTYVTIVYNNPNEPVRFLDEEGQPRCGREC